MQAHVLHLSCIGRDALVQDWEVGASSALVTAYRVFDTENGYGVAYQSVVLDVQTQKYECVVVPTRVADGIGMEVEAIERMRTYAQWERDDAKERYEEQGVTVLCGVVIDEVKA